MSRDEMEAEGFIYSGTCNCDGTANYKYTKGNYLFYIRPKKGTFHVKQNLSYILKNIPLKMFHEATQNIFVQNVLEGAHSA